MPWGYVAAAAGSYLASRGSRQSGTQTIDNAPWIGQQPYLRDLFQRSQDWLNTGGPQFFPGQTYAGFDPLQNQAQQQALSYASGLSPLLDQANSGLALGLNPLGNPLLNQATAGLNDVYRLSGGLTSQALNPQNSITAPQIGFNPTTPQIQAPASLGAMQNQTANSDIWQSVGDSSARRLTENFTDTLLPAIRSGAGAAGQYGGSTRQGIAEGIALRGLGNQLSDLRSNLGQAAASEAINTRNLGTQLGAGLAGQQAQLGFGTQQLGANLAAQQAGLGLNAQQLSEQQRQSQVQAGLGAAGLNSSLFGSTYSPTLGAFTSSLGLTPQIAGLGLLPSQITGQVGAQRQGMEQQGISEAMARHNFEQNQPLANLQAYQGLIGGQQYGSQQQSPLYSNPFASALGGGIIGGQLWKMYGGQPQQQTGFYPGPYNGPIVFGSSYGE